ncbi:hypothetical protein AHAS_Ahas15G0188700 [Arachis hypogaea]
MQDCPPMPQDDPYCEEFNNSSSCAWKDQNQRALNVSYSTYQEPSSLEQTFNSFMESCQTSPPSFSSENSSSLNYPSTQNLFQNSQSTQTSMNQSLSELETMLERYEEEAQISWNEQENSFRNMEVLVNQMLSAKEEVEEQNEEAPELRLPSGKGEEQTVSEEEEEEVPVSSETSRENEVVEVYEPRIPYPQRLIEVTTEHEDSLPKDLMENHEEEMEEGNQGSSHLIEVESCVEEGLMELPMQEASEEENTPTIT